MGIETGLLPDQLAARFTPVRLLGQGAMGRVVLARDRELGREVAIKLMLDKPEGERLARFHREAECLARIKHPAVVAILGVGTTVEGPYLLLEPLDGQPLQKVAARIDPRPVLLEVADGLDAIHAAGLVHRDIKPSNLMVTRRGRGVIVDFGLVADPERTRLTRTSDLAGSIAFLAPELLRGERPSPATDWYAWGTAAYQVLEGRLPYEAETLVTAVDGGRLPEPRFTKLSPQDPWVRVILLCLSESQGIRPANAAQVRDLLRGATGVTSTGEFAPLTEASLAAAARPRGAFGALALSGLAVGLLALGAGFAIRPASKEPPPVSPGAEPVEEPAGSPAPLLALVDKLWNDPQIQALLRLPNTATTPEIEERWQGGRLVLASKARALDEALASASRAPLSPAAQHAAGRAAALVGAMTRTRLRCEGCREPPLGPDTTAALAALVARGLRARPEPALTSETPPGVPSAPRDLAWERAAIEALSAGGRSWKPLRSLALTEGVKERAWDTYALRYRTLLGEPFVVVADDKAGLKDLLRSSLDETHHREEPVEVSVGLEVAPGPLVLAIMLWGISDPDTVALHLTVRGRDEDVLGAIEVPMHTFWAREKEYQAQDRYKDWDSRGILVRVEAAALPEGPRRAGLALCGLQGTGAPKEVAFLATVVQLVGGPAPEGF